MIKKIVAAFLIWLIGGWPTFVFALPSGGQIVSGDGSIVETSATQLDINQNSSQLIATFNHFNTAANETVNVNQNYTSDVFLAKVLGTDPTLFLGKLNAKGQVFITNGSGVYFGPGSQIDVHGLVATTMDISNQDFLDRNYKFSQNLDNPLSSVINEGVISATSYVGLLAPAVENRKDIVVTASLGSIDLASGTAATLDFTGDGLIQFEVTQEVSGTVLDKDGNELEDRVSNTGLLHADGGQIRMSAKDAGDVIRHVVNMEGMIKANSVIEKDGKVFLMGGDSGVVNVSGTIDASGNDAGEKGGTVQVTGEYVGLFDNARVDVSGDAGGGTALIGGDYQGKNEEVQNAERTYIGEDTVIDASAGTTGDGGKVIVWADDVTRFYGSVFATGGSLSGDGGFIEISGKEHLNFSGTIDATSVYGVAGTVLFDPKNIIIANGGIDVVLTNDAFAENSTDSVTFDATLITAITNLGVAVILQASNDITINEAITTVNGGGAGGNITLQAGRSVLINADITTDDGKLVIFANEINSNGVVDAQRDSGTAVITMADGVTINAGTGDIEITLSDGLGNTYTTNGNITVENLTTTGDVFIALNGDSDGGSLLRASNDSLITANSLAIDHFTASGMSGSIGTSAAPLRIQVNNIDAHTHYGTAPIYLESLQSLIIGGSVLGSGFGVKGVQSSSDDNTDGDIVITVVGNLTTAGSSTGLIQANGAAGKIDIQATGNITLSDAISSGGGTITLAATDIVISAALAGTGGNVVLQAENDITVGSAISMTTTGAMLTLQAGDDVNINASITTTDGAISITANDATGSQANIGTMGAFITNASTYIIDAGNATIVLSAQGNIELPQLTTTSTSDTAITITSTAGEIIDDFIGAGGIDLNAANGGAVLSAALGIGNTDEVDTTLNKISLTNTTTSGFIDITDTDDIIITSIAHIGTSFARMQSTAGSITVESGGGGITSAAALFLNANGAAGAVNIDAAVNITGALTVTANNGITLNSNVTTAGTTSFDTDLDNTSGGDLTFNAGVTLDSTNNAIDITANDVVINGNINSGTATTTLLVSDAAIIGLGVTAGGMHITGAELQNITAANLIIGDNTNGTITVDGITSGNAGNISGTITLNATNTASAVDFSNNASVFSGGLTVNAENGINVNVDLTTNGTTTFNADSDDDGTGSFAVADSQTVNTSGNNLSISAGDFDLNTSGKLNAGVGDITIFASIGRTITIGATGANMSIEDVELGNITASNLTIGASTSDNIIVDGVTAGNTGNISGTITLDASGVGNNTVTFSGSTSSFTNSLTVSAAGNISQGVAITVGGSSNLTNTAGNITMNNAGNNLGTNLTVSSIGNISVVTNSDLADLTMTVTPTGSSTYSISASNLTFNVTESADVTITEVTDTTDLNFSFTTTTGNIILADSAVSTGAGNVTLKSTLGSITELVSSTAANITTTGAIALIAGTSIGTTGANNEVDFASSRNLTLDVNNDFWVRQDSGLDLTDLTLVINPATGTTYTLSVSGITLSMGVFSGDINTFALSSTSALNFGLTLDTGNLSTSGVIDTMSGNFSATTTTGSQAYGNTLDAANVIFISAGDITQTAAITATGTSSFTVTGASSTITLMEANDFTGAVSVTGVNGLIQITDSNAFVLGASATTGDVAIVAGGDVTQTGPVVTTMGLVVSTTGAVTLDNVLNDVNILSISATGNVNYTDSNAFTVGSVNSVDGMTSSGSVHLTALMGNITVSNNTTTDIKVTASTGGIIFSHLAIEAGGDVSFTDTSTDVDFLAIDAQGFDVSFYDVDALDINTVDTVVGVKAKSFTHSGPGPLTITSPIVVDAVEEITPEVQEDIDTATQAGFADSFLTNAAGGGC